ncbi:hypothetical protein BGZ58_001067 [Dissophora ornata]|nr:hypothetical protein BGZ58_001067 [Dissophora ornata]
MDPSAYGLPPLPHSVSTVTSVSMPYPTPLPNAESMTSFTPMVPSMQPAASHPSSANSSPAFSPPEAALNIALDASKRHRRHPSSGQHSPELRKVMQTKDFQQQQQIMMANRENALYAQANRVQPHQSRSPRAAVDLKIDVQHTMQARATTHSALGSPTESGPPYSPGPLSAPSPMLGPINNSLVDTVMEVIPTFQQHSLNDPLLTPSAGKEFKLDALELEKPSTRSELAELTKQELIEKVMHYERTIEGSIPMRMMSTVKQEPSENEPMKDVQSTSQTLAASNSQQQEQDQQQQGDKSPQLSTLSHPAPALSPPPAIKQEEDIKEEKRLTSPILTSYAVKSPTNLHSVLSVKNEDEEDGEDDGEDEENEDELDDDENDGEDGEESSPKPRKVSADTNGAEDLETPQQLVCLWRDCNTPFETMVALNEHVAESHIGSGKACYSCDWQGCPRMMKPFTKRHKMYNHLRTHTGERPFRCPVPGCDKKFSRPDSLTTHTKTHSNVRPYICQVKGCTKAYYHARSLKKHELAHESKQGTGVLRGTGAAHGTASISPADKTSESGSVSVTSSSQQHRPHHGHPYHPDYTGVSARNKHRRHLSQSATAVAAATAAATVSAASATTIIAPIPTVPVTAFPVQTLLSSLSDSSLAAGGTPLSINTTTSGKISPNPMSMAGGGGNTGFGQAIAGFNATLLTPALSTHSSSSSVPSLSMMMGGTPVSTADGSVVMMEPMFQTQGNGLVSEGGGVGGGGGVTQTMTPSGSPGFQAAIVPTATLRSPTPTAVPMTMPMTMTMSVVSGTTMSSHPTPAMLSNMAMQASTMGMTMSVQPSPSSMTMAMMHNDGTGSGNPYLVANDQHVGGIGVGVGVVVPSALDVNNLASQVGSDMGYNPMPVDPQQM